MRYRYGESVYNIKIVNKTGKNSGTISIKLNGDELENKEIILQNNGGVYNVEAEI